MWGKTPKSAPEPVTPAAPAPQPLPARPKVQPVADISSSARIGAAITIQGEIKGSEDLCIDGEVQGAVRLEDAVLRVGKQGQVRADIHAREITVEGRVEGNLTATVRVRIGSTGAVHGEIRTPRIAIDDGAILQGSVDIVRPGESRPATGTKSHAVSAGTSKAAPHAAPAEPAAVGAAPNSAVENIQ